MNREQARAYAEAMSAQCTALMTAASAGDRQAFDELTHLVRGRGYRMARSWVGVLLSPDEQYLRFWPVHTDNHASCGNNVFLNHQIPAPHFVRSTTE